MATSLKALADPRVVRVAPELYRLPSVATRVPLDGRVTLQSVRTVTPASVTPPAPATRMVPPLFLLMRPPRPTVPPPEPNTTIPGSSSDSFREIRFPLPPGFPRPQALPIWKFRGWARDTRWGPKRFWEYGGRPGIIRFWSSCGRYNGCSRAYEYIDCNGTVRTHVVNPRGEAPELEVTSWELVGFAPCRQPTHPEVLPLVEPERPEPKWIPYLPTWIPALPEIQPVTEPEEEPEEDEEPLPVPLPLPLPALPPAVPEVPVEVPSEAETERRLAPVPVEVPQIDPKRAAVPVTTPQTQPYPWKVEPQRPVVVPVADPLPRPAPPTTLPPTQTPTRTQPQIVPASTTLVIESVRQVLERSRRNQLTVEVQSQPETLKVSRVRVKTDEEDKECCEDLECLKVWCQFSQWNAGYYEGEWEEDGYVAKRRRSTLVLPGPLQSFANYLNERLSDLKKELCEAIDLVAFIDQQPEPYSDRRRHGPQWKIYWGKPKRSQQSMKTLTLPEVNRIDMPPQPPPINDGKVCLHYGIEAVSFWGRIWVGRSSAEALESYLRQIYGEDVKFTRSDSPGRQYKQGQLKPMRARYWNGEKWLPPRRWSPRYWEGGE